MQRTKDTRTNATAAPCFLYQQGRAARYVPVRSRSGTTIGLPRSMIPRCVTSHTLSNEFDLSLVSRYSCKGVDG